MTDLGDAPLITVYVATRNRASVLPRALRSVWRQQRDDLELIVVDDASDDATPALLEAWAGEGRLRWLRNEANRGACASRNLALRNARGRFVTGLDDDDEMLPGRIAQLLAALDSRDAFACASDVLVDARGRTHLRLCPGRIDARAILARNLVGNQVLAERHKLLACGGFDETLPAAQDYDLWIRMILMHGPARGLFRPLQRVHVPATGMSRISTSPARRKGYWLVYRKHRDRMDRQARAAHLYNLRRANGHPTRLPRDARFLAPGNRLRLAWHAVRDLARRRAR